MRREEIEGQKNPLYAFNRGRELIFCISIRNVLIINTLQATLLYYPSNGLKWAISGTQIGNISGLGYLCMNYKLYIPCFNADIYSKKFLLKRNAESRA